MEDGRRGLRRAVMLDADRVEFGVHVAVVDQRDGGERVVDGLPDAGEVRVRYGRDGGEMQGDGGEVWPKSKSHSRKSVWWMDCASVSHSMQATLAGHSTQAIACAYLRVEGPAEESDESRRDVIVHRGHGLALVGVGVGEGRLALAGLLDVRDLRDECEADARAACQQGGRGRCTEEMAWRDGEVQTWVTSMKQMLEAKKGSRPSKAPLTSPALQVVFTGWTCRWRRWPVGSAKGHVLVGCRARARKRYEVGV